MKSKLLLTLLLVSIFGLNIQAQVNLVLQPGSEGKDAEIGSLVPTTNYGSSIKINPYAWTQSGYLNVVRPLIEFDLSSIPEGSVIIDAKLSFYYFAHVAPANVHSGSNALVIQRIITEWIENTVTWNNQPSVTTVNQVFLPQSTSNTQNYLDIDVTSLLQDMIDDSLNSHGFLIKLLAENPLATVILASSDHTNSALHPKLVINYSPTGVNEIKNKINVSINPNPFKNSSILEFENPNNESFTFKLFGVDGHLIKTISDVKTNKIKIERENLPAGLYIYQLRNKEGIGQTGKLVIE